MNENVMAIVMAAGKGTRMQSKKSKLVHQIYGKELVKRVTDHYKDYLRIVVICLMENVKFYEYCGFGVEEGKRALFITDLEN